MALEPLSLSILFLNLKVPRICFTHCDYLPLIQLGQNEETTKGFPEPSSADDSSCRYWGFEGTENSPCSTLESQDCCTRNCQGGHSGLDTPVQVNPFNFQNKDNCFYIFQLGKAYQPQNVLLLALFQALGKRRK